ncbi:MAG: succinate dehydrogenase, hydrophobic membrane anchor protein [Legionellales bacterium]|nr:MAG: succinate dehydrogenase, hydrophobic membrane anchor protein [Legionellales bacterium]
MVSGIKSWLTQRITAVILLIYTIIISWFFTMTPEVTYSLWVDFITQPWVKLATIITLTALVWHAWLGLWTVSTDYLNKCLIIRLLTQLGLLTILGTALAWGGVILYGS